jgi:hypothetical protein
VLGDRQISFDGPAIPFDGLGKIALKHEAALVHHRDVEGRLRGAGLCRAQQPARAGLGVLGHADALHQPARQLFHGGDATCVGPISQLAGRHPRPVE